MNANNKKANPKNFKYRFMPEELGRKIKKIAEPELRYLNKNPNKLPGLTRALNDPWLGPLAVVASEIRVVGRFQSADRCGGVVFISECFIIAINETHRQNRLWRSRARNECR